MTPNRLEKFLALLGKSYRAQTAPAPTGAFEQNVMRALRTLGAAKESPAWLAWQPLVLRLAAASALVAVLMLGVAAQQGLAPSYEVAQLAIELQEEAGLDPAGLP